MCSTRDKTNLRQAFYVYISRVGITCLPFLVCTVCTITRDTALILQERLRK